ncbi:MAG: alanine--tRNA ligase-related protein [Candidatus Dependentiae bacterium]
MNPTKLLYMDDFNQLYCTARVESVFSENGKDIVILDQTVFYPQGGGQPYDKGIIKSNNGEFVVEEVRFGEGMVKHIGFFRHGMFPAFGKGRFMPGEIVECIVEQDRRVLNTRLHSAGHLIDLAVQELNLPWVPAKGFHFPEGPYVEYVVESTNFDKEKTKEDIEVICNRLINENMQTSLLFMNKEDMKSVCKNVPAFIPENKPARVVMYGKVGIPCGGTHVKNSADIKHMGIRKIKVEGNHVKVAYEIA